MNTVRADICYRPLRIGWAIRSNDIDAFRKAVRMSYSLWGGRFNPIIVADREEEARQLVDLFRVDIIIPVGGSDEVQNFHKKFPYLNNPLFDNSIFSDGSDGKYAKVLDMHNALLYFSDKPWWKTFKDNGVRLYSWQEDDPLADVFLVQKGAYPDATETSKDYRDLFLHFTEATEHTIDPGEVIPEEVLVHPSISYMSRHLVKRHYSIQGSGRNRSGFFVGDASNVDDLINYWNLRAADTSLCFVDTNHFGRYVEIIPSWEKIMRENFIQSDSMEGVTLWSRRENLDENCKLFGDMRLSRTSVSSATWNGLNVQVPMMHLGETSVLGVIDEGGGKPKVSFSLNEKPFSSNVMFSFQRLVASISFIGNLYNDEQHKLVPPYIPELNESYSRKMHIGYSDLRIEPGRVGLVINVADHDDFLYALPVTSLLEYIFDLAGFSVTLSKPGLIARQLISQLGGIHCASVLKIAGVRRLIKKHGPLASFTKNSALQLIGSTDPDNPDAKFSDYLDLYIEPRSHGTKLDPPAVFSYLVEKGLFRIGAELTCDTCQMKSWTSLDLLKQRVICELCGYEYDATRQLMNEKYYYRRTGVLGAEKNVEGAVPVVLTLKQLKSNIISTFGQESFSPSINLKSKEGKDPLKCEIDFVWVIPRMYSRKTVVILGECKDQKNIDENDINNLRRVAHALPKKYFKTFILLSKLCQFNSQEIELAKALNDKYRQRAILLTNRELEPHFIYERINAELGVKWNGSRPEDLAIATEAIYFSETKKSKPSE